MSEHGLYKFVDVETDKILYIGKSNNSLKQRIEDHKRAKGIDEKFKPYLNKCKVYITTLPNSTETDILERALINQYKPILNGTDNQEGFSSYINVTEPEWIDYEVYLKQFEKEPSNKPKKDKRPYTDLDFYLCEIDGTKYWLDNSYKVKVKGRNTIVPMYENKESALQVMRNIVDICMKYDCSGVYKDTYEIPGEAINKNVCLKNHFNKQKDIQMFDGLICHSSSIRGCVRITTYMRWDENGIVGADFFKGGVEILKKFFDSQMDK